MSRVIFASHGGLSKGMKDSVSMIIGDLAKDIETYSLLPGQNPEDFYQEVLKEANENEEQILILCDIKGGSVHTALSKLAQASLSFAVSNKINAFVTYDCENFASIEIALFTSAKASLYFFSFR